MISICRRTESNPWPTFLEASASSQDEMCEPSKEVSMGENPTVQHQLLNRSGLRVIHPEDIVLPGQTVVCDSTCMRGHGTQSANSEGDGTLAASVCGVVTRLNRLVRVRPPKSRFRGETGDVVVGRVIGLGTKRWLVDTGSYFTSVLLLSSVDLPQLRRRSTEDELAMRQLLSEGDVVCAEVQTIFHDGSLSLQTRGSSSAITGCCGRLSHGLLVSVPAELVRRTKTHFHTLPCGVSMVIGVNGNVWVAATENCAGLEHKSTNRHSDSQLKPVSLADRQAITMIRNVIRVLAAFKIQIYDTSIMTGYDTCQQNSWESKDLLIPEIQEQLASETINKLEISM